MINNTIVDPAFRLMRFPLDGELNFYLKNDFIYLENDLESPLIFILFWNGKQNKKESNSLFRKRWSVKIGSGSGVRLPIGKVR